MFYTSIGRNSTAKNGIPILGFDRPHALTIDVIWESRIWVETEVGWGLETEMGILVFDWSDIIT